MVIPASGLVGRYDGSSWNSTQWTDLSGAGNHATIVRGSVKVSEAGFRGTPYIYGTTEDGIRFPAAILPATYTLFHVTKYNGANRGRIFDGVAGGITNWLSGFNRAMSGKAYHNNWITPDVDVHGSNWVYSTDQNALYRSNKVDRTIAAPGTPSYDQISINYGINYTIEPSDWACAEVIVYNRTLTTNEINQVEDELYATYGPPGLYYPQSTRQNQLVDALRDGSVTRPSHAFSASTRSGMWRQTTGNLALSASTGVGIGVVRPLTLASNSAAANVFVGGIQYTGLVASDIVLGTFAQSTFPTVFGTSSKSFTGNSIAFGGIEMTVDAGANVSLPLLTDRSVAISGGFKATTRADITVTSINGSVVKSRRGWDPPNFMRFDILGHLQASRDKSTPMIAMDAIYVGPSVGSTSGYYAGGVLLADGRVFMVPLFTNQALIYDPVSQVISTAAGYYSFIGGALMADGRVFLLPGQVYYAAVYDPNTNTLMNLNRTFETVYPFGGATLLPDGRVFCVPYASTIAVLFDPASNSFSDSSVVFPGDNAFFGGVLLPDGRVFLVPENTTNAWVYDPTTDSVTVCEDFTGSYNGGVLLPDGRVFCVPYMATEARIYDPITDTTIVPTGEYPGNYAFVGGVLLPDGRVFCIPFESTYAVVYDPVKDITTIPRGTFEPYTVFGGVLTPQGSVICMPYDSKNIMIARCGTGDMPLSIATSPFLNKSF